MKSIMRGNQGFLLLETVIALGLFSLSALSIIYLSFSRRALEAEIKQRTKALNHARTKLELFDGEVVEITTPRDIKKFLELCEKAEGVSPEQFRVCKMEGKLLLVTGRAL